MNHRIVVACGFVFMCIFLLSGTAFFLTGCGHYQNWWSLFAPLIIVLAFMSPAVCHGYDTEDVGMLNWDMDMDISTFKSCRDMGWVLAMILGIFSQSIPIIVWYNEPLSLPWPGVLWVMTGIMMWWWTVLIALKIFVFKKREGPYGGL